MHVGSALLDHEARAEMRIQSCFQLLRDGSQGAVIQLIQGLFTDPSPIVRHECAYSLGEIPSKEGSNALIRAIYNDTNTFVKHEAALAVSNLGQGQDALKYLLDHNDPDIVKTAIISLRRYAMKSQHLTLPGNPREIVLDSDEHPEHRIQAAFKLLEDNSEDAIHILLDALDQERDPIVKHEIIFCLGEAASTRVVLPLVNHMLGDSNPFVKHEAALSLGTIGDKNAEPAIRTLLDHPNPDIVESAQIALDRLLLPQDTFEIE